MPFNLTRTREIASKTCLRHFAGRDSIKSMVFDASTLVADADGRYTIPIGTFLTKNPSDRSKVKIYTGAGTDTDEIQTVTITGTPTGGSFTLTNPTTGHTTAAIAFNANAAAVKAALVALPEYGTTDLTVGGGALPGTPVTITFVGHYAHEAQTALTANGAGLTGGTTPAVAVTRSTPGTAAERVIGVFDGPDRDFFGTSAAANEPIPVYYHACVFDVSKLQNWDSYGAAAQTALPNCDFY